MVIGEGVAVGKTENKREVRVSRAEPPEPLSEPPLVNWKRASRLVSAMAEALEARGALALAAPTAARSSRLASKLYLPSALVEMQLPSGLGDLTTVPRLQRHDEEHDPQAMLDEYVLAIRATVRVFATYQHKKQTLVAYDGYMLWIDAWLRLSGFGSYIDVDMAVREPSSNRRACVRAVEMAKR